MISEKIGEKLESFLGTESVERDAPMSRYTSFKAGGRADMLVVPRDTEQLKQVLKLLHREGCSHMVMGNGSDILVRDGGYRGVIVKIGDAFDWIRQDGEKLICGCGTLLSAVAKKAAAAGLAGFEFASGIPGSVGGAVFMNAGAYGGEMAHILEGVRLLSADGEKECFMAAKELDMGYRYTRLHDTGDVAVEAVFQLVQADREEIRRRIADFTRRRNAKQPVAFPSAGSFFKRPEGYFAGKLIQDAGLKGLSVGGAQVSELHSGFIINRGNATATDILQLMELVQARVLDEFGVKLEPEVRIIGEE